MVKGISKRVVVVRPAKSELFEEAIFIVRGAGSAQAGRTAEDILNEACRIADSCTRGRRKRRGLLSRLPAPVFAAFGAAAVGLVWLFTSLF